MTRLLRRATLACALLGFPGVADADPPSDPSRARIEAALANVVALQRPGQIGLATAWDGNKYVQCRYRLDQTMRCEAAGARLQPSLGHVLTRDRIGRLAALGWDLDGSFGNYARTFEPPVAVDAVADAVEQALGQGYEADLLSLEVRTDWVKDVPCPPRNGPGQNLAGLISDAPAMAATAIRSCGYAEPPAPAPDLDSAAALVGRHGARVTGEVQRLMINGSRQVFMILDTAVGYVQCAPDTDPKGLYCEAVSADSRPELAGALTPERVARLHAAGFADPGRSPNFSKAYRPGSVDAGSVARELLTLLHDVYGYSGRSPFRVLTEKGAD